MRTFVVIVGLIIVMLGLATAERERGRTVRPPSA
jgi:hypothetical protein